MFACTNDSAFAPAGQIGGGGNGSSIKLSNPQLSCKTVSYDFRVSTGKGNSKDCAGNMTAQLELPNGNGNYN
jgi:hypothetical protein